MSFKLTVSSEKPPKIPNSNNATGEDCVLRWSDVEVDIESLSSISSESESGSEYDSEQRARPRPSNEIWTTNEIWEGLMVTFFNILKSISYYFLETLSRNLK